MATEFAVFCLRGHPRSEKIGNNLHRGLKRLGLKSNIYRDTEYTKDCQATVAAFYGYTGRHPQIFRDFLDSGRRVVFIDLGYWGRLNNGRWSGYHKVAVDSRHPTAYFNQKPHDAKRLIAQGVRIRPWKIEGSHILLAGMSEKAANSIGMIAEEWERETIRTLKGLTDRPIVYRPKPSWTGARPIDGVGYSPTEQPLKDALKGCWSVVTHHSNVAVDALVSGVPVFATDGVASVMSAPSLEAIEDPYLSEDREGWAANVAWTQFSVEEMRSGYLWGHLIKEGLISA